MTANRPQVVIVGAGFAGLSAAKALARTDADVIVIDRRNHHLFQPLLYQVATAGLAPTQIASPVRTVLRGQANVEVELDEVTGVDLANRRVMLGGRTRSYDALILATGATHAYFGHDEWARHAPGLKSLEDALALRRRILLALEAAEVATTDAERTRLLTFVVVGAGPTGVELAGAIAELAKRALTSDFRHIRDRKARVLLVEAGSRVLTAFPEPLSAYAKRALEHLGVEVRLGHAVTGCDGGGVDLGDERIAAANIVWAAGVQASPAGLWLGAETDRAGRVRVEPDLTLPGYREVFVVGDVGLIRDAAGVVVPGVAPAAKQAGAYAARTIAARLTGRPTPGPFRYADVGSLATVGRKAAAVSIGPVRLTGFLAWAFWCAAHVYFLIGFRNRAQVVLDWTWSYLTFERGARLIPEAVSRQAREDNGVPVRIAS